MELALSELQQDLFDAFEAFFCRESPPSAARASEPLGFDPGLWSRFAQMDVSWSHARLDELSVIAECAGRWIAPIPLVEHAVATRALRAGDDNAGNVATIAVRPAVDGRWSLVPAGAVAHHVVGLVDDQFVTVNAVPLWHAPSNHACAPIGDRAAAPSRVLGDRADFQRSRDEWKVLTAALLVGVAARSLELAVAYVGERHQFGAPIGSFQAIQHSLAALPGPIDGARLLVHEAAGALDGGGAGPNDNGPPDIAMNDIRMNDIGMNDIGDPCALASMAFLFASDVAKLATDRALHVHGGYGFAEEYDVQLYYRRARGWPLILGDPSGEYDRLAELLWPRASS